MGTTDNLIANANNSLAAQCGQRISGVIPQLSWNCRPNFLRLANIGLCEVKSLAEPLNSTTLEREVGREEGNEKERLASQVRGERYKKTTSRAGSRQET